MRLAVSRRRAYTNISDAIKKDELPYKQDIENRRKRFVEDVCTLIFINDYRDPRIEELSNSELTYTNYNQQLYQRLTPPDD